MAYPRKVIRSRCPRSYFWSGKILRLVDAFIFHHWVSLVVDAELAKGQHTMSSKEKKLWEQAIWILKQNSVTVGIPAALQAPAEAPKRAA